MTHRGPARRTTRRIPTILVAGLLVAVAAIAAFLAVSGHPLLSSASSTASSSPPASSSPAGPPSSPTVSPIPILRTEDPGALGGTDGIVPGAPMVLGPEDRGALGVADGVVPDGTTVFDDDIPGVANLDPDLLGALRHAATHAADEGVEFFVESGWRSREYQERLFRQALEQYGSEEEAARWVAPPGASTHESGDAVDIGPLNAMAWLSEHGAMFGLCQIYRNEPWHYELHLEAIDHGCPPMHADSIHDPRLQQ